MFINSIQKTIKFAQTLLGRTDKFIKEPNELIG